MIIETIETGLYKFKNENLWPAWLDSWKPKMFNGSLSWEGLNIAYDYRSVEELIFVIKHMNLGVYHCVGYIDKKCAIFFSKLLGSHFYLVFTKIA